MVGRVVARSPGRECEPGGQNDGEQPERRDGHGTALGQSQEGGVALEQVPGRQPDRDAGGGDTRGTGQQGRRMVSVPGEEGPGTAGQRGGDDGEFMGVGVAVLRHPEEGDQERRHPSARQQDAADRTGGV
jgi:hypothetical protein